MVKKENLTIMMHSYKGGTGKSLISLNAAAALMRRGKKVVLLDFDFLGPGLFSSFMQHTQSSKTKYLNDLFFRPNTSVGIEDILIDIKQDGDPKESAFYVGLANPEPAEINNLSRLNRNQFMEAFRKTLMMQEYLTQEQKIDYVIIDAGPGFRFDVANSMVISDVICSVMKPSESDLEGTKHLLKSVSAFVSGQKQGIILNRSVSSDATSGVIRAEGDIPILKSRQEEIVDEIINYSKRLNVPVLGSIPCLCDVSRGENYKTIISREYPDHIFSKAINEIIENILAEF